MHIQITLCTCNLLLCNCKAPKPAIKILLLTFYIWGQNPDLIKFGLEPQFVLHSIVMFTTIHVQYTLFPLKMLSFSQHTNVWFTFKIITLYLCKTPPLKVKQHNMEHQLSLKIILLLENTVSTDLTGSCQNISEDLLRIPNGHLSSYFLS